MVVTDPILLLRQILRESEHCLAVSEACGRWGDRIIWGGPVFWVCVFLVDGGGLKYSFLGLEMLCFGGAFSLQMIAERYVDRAERLTLQLKAIIEKKQS